MGSILLGDFRWYEAVPPSATPLTPQRIIEEENLLLHQFNRALRQGAGILRTPTASCNRAALKKEQLEERIEAIHNIAASQAREAITKGGYDVLLAGVVGPHPNPEPGMRMAEMERIFGEPAIYLVDKGVDVLLLEGFRDLKQFEVATYSMRRAHSVPLPLAAFFTPESLDSQDAIEELFSFAEHHELELLGLEIDLSKVEGLLGRLPTTQMALGFQLSVNQEIDLSAEVIRDACSALQSLEPTMILGGAGMTESQWLACRHALGDGVPAEG